VPYTISEEQKHKNDETRERLLRSGEFSGIPKQERNICRVLTSRQCTQRKMISSSDATRRRYADPLQLSISEQLVPRQGPELMDIHPAKCYTGKFSTRGDVYYTASQDWTIRLYSPLTAPPSSPPDADAMQDVDAASTRLAPYLSVRGEPGRWSITDCRMANNNKFLLYASLSPVLHFVGLALHHDTGTPFRDTLDFSKGCVWGGFSLLSLRLSGDNREVLSGASDDCVYLYDLERQLVTAKIKAHQDEVNAVTYLYPCATNLLVSGSDDTYIKLWDKRCHASPALTLPGHTEGITCLASKGDGHYLLSNAKDQSLKLWDLRTLRAVTAVNESVNTAQSACCPSSVSTTPDRCIKEVCGLVIQQMASDCSVTPVKRKCDGNIDDRPSKVSRTKWDYRMMNYPHPIGATSEPRDRSVTSCYGHAVLRSLIRCDFSPVFSTGQRYLYTGSADGAVYIYDLGGNLVQRLHASDAVVRDVSWHPYLPELYCVSFNGELLRFKF
jgi:WD repeat-containing protein 23